MLEKKDTNLAPSKDKLKTKSPKKDTLSSIIDKVNERYEGVFTSDDKAIVEKNYDMLISDKDMRKFKKLATYNNPEMFVKNLFLEKFQEIATKCYMNNDESFKKLFSDNDFYQSVMTEMAKSYTKKLRKD